MRKFVHSLRRITEAGLLQRQRALWHSPRPKCVRQIQPSDLIVMKTSCWLPDQLDRTNSSSFAGRNAKCLVRALNSTNGISSERCYAVHRTAVAQLPPSTTPGASQECTLTRSATVSLYGLDVLYCALQYCIRYLCELKGSQSLRLYFHRRSFMYVVAREYMSGIIQNSYYQWKR